MAAFRTAGLSLSWLRLQLKAAPGARPGAASHAGAAAATGSNRRRSGARCSLTCPGPRARGRARRAQSLAASVGAHYSQCKPETRSVMMVVCGPQHDWPGAIIATRAAAAEKWELRRGSHFPASE